MRANPVQADGCLTLQWSSDYRKRTVIGQNISGLYAATITPRHPSNEINVPDLLRLFRFLHSKGITSFAINGATGEFCLTLPSHLRIILKAAIEVGVDHRRILCGVGSPGTALSVELAGIAEEFGVQGLLLPMPNFFPYQQDDLDLFARTVAASTSLPILLYNLPQFASGLHAETVGSLIMDVENIVGIKDSSGSLDILRYLQNSDIEAIKMVGNDNVLAEALEEGVCDGVVSGVACALPEIVSRLVCESDKRSAQFTDSAELLWQFIQQLDSFPTPWGLKFALQARKVLDPVFAQPVTARRIMQSQEFSAWLASWLPRAIAARETILL